MLRKLRQPEIISDNVYGFEIHGIIKKINIKTKQNLLNVKVHIETEDNEVLFSDYVEDGKSLYPKNIDIINNVICKSDIVLFGRLFIKIDGMIEQQMINEINVIIEDTQEIKQGI